MRVSENVQVQSIAKVSRAIVAAKPEYVMDRRHRQQSPNTWHTCFTPNSPPGTGLSSPSCVSISGISSMLCPSSWRSFLNLIPHDSGVASLVLHTDPAATTPAAAASHCAATDSSVPCRLPSSRAPRTHRSGSCCTACCTRTAAQQ